MVSHRIIQGQLKELHLKTVPNLLIDRMMLCVAWNLLVIQQRDLLINVDSEPRREVYFYHQKFISDLLVAELKRANEKIRNQL